MILPKSLSLIIKYFNVYFSVSSKSKPFVYAKSSALNLLKFIPPGTYKEVICSFYPWTSLAAINIFFLLLFSLKIVNLN